MSGVFRDPASGDYRYYSYNDYEERRLRDWDDRYGYGSTRASSSLPAPFDWTPWKEEADPAPAPAPAPAPVPTPPDPQTAAELQALIDAAKASSAPPLQPPTAFDFETFRNEWNAAHHPSVVPPVAEWPGPVPSEVAAVSLPELSARVGDLTTLPATVGDVPAFDEAFDALAAEGRSITYMPVEASLLVPSF